MVVPAAAILQATGAATGALNEMKGAVGEVNGLFGQMTAPLKGVIGSLTSIPEFFKGIAQAAAAWVKEFNPGIVERMNDALRSLTATVGYSLEPIVAGFADATREFAGSILQGMNALRPAVEQTVNLFRMAMQPALQIVNRWLLDVADRAQRLAPLLSFFGTWLDGALTRLAVVFETASVLGSAFLDLASAAGEMLAAISPLARGMGWENFGDVLKDTRSLFLELNKAGIMLVDTILRLAGQGALADKILRGLSARPPTSGRPEAPRDFGMGDLESIYKRRLLESARGQGMDPAARQASMMEDVRKFAEMQLNRQDKIGSVAELILEVLRELARELPQEKWARQAARNSPIPEWARGPFHP